MPPDPRAWDVDPSRLAGTRFATVRFFDEIGSTNTEAVEAARAGAGEGLVVVADHQTAGRGRLGRTWSTAPGTALLVSVLLRPPLPIDEVPIVLMAAGLAACDGVEGAAGFRPRLKWPNDLVVADRKLAGLLTEFSSRDVWRPGWALLSNRDQVASALQLLVELDWLAIRIRTGTGGRKATLDAYRADSATLGRRVRVELTGGEALEGEAAGVADDGRLVVVDAAGEHLVSVGDVKHLRT